MKDRLEIAAARLAEFDRQKRWLLADDRRYMDELRRVEAYLAQRDRL